ncbi:MAG: RNA polymerase sigma factor [Sphingobacteriaceae bacterium]
METPKDWLNDNPAAAFKHFYHTNYPWLEKYIRQNSGTAQDAQDVFQESLIAAWINLKDGRFAGTADGFNGYLRTICKNKWISHLRSSAHKKMHYAANILTFDQKVEPPAIMEEQILVGDSLKISFDQLGEKCRVVLGLFYYKRKSLAEIGLLHNNTEDSIKTIKYRCMMQLRNIYLEKYKGNGQV